MNKYSYYGVKTILVWRTQGRPRRKDKFYKENIVLVEERVVLIKAKDFDHAMKLGERETKEYARRLKTTNPYGQNVILKYTGICEAFELFDDLGKNTEVFSSTRIFPKKTDRTALANIYLGKKETMKIRGYRKSFLSVELLKEITRLEEGRQA